MGNRAIDAAAAGALPQKKASNMKKHPRPWETIIQSILFFCGAVSILTTVGITIVLAQQSLRFFTEDACTNRIGTGNEITCTQVSIVEFFTSTTWEPTILEFGILPLLNATIGVALIGTLVAFPLGLGAAIYLSEYASPRVRSILKPILEILAGIPTVVYGYFALTFVTPRLRDLLGVENVQIFNMASAGIVIGILIIPYMASLSEDALRAVPDSLRQASLGLGATKLETTLRVILPAAVSGIIAAFIVSVSRAVGETMVALLAAGAGPNFTFNPFNSAETMAGHIARISSGDISYETVQYTSVFSVGLMLFLITLVLNILSRRFVERFREVYE
ncbi:MAG: phosphate ABC transporter permease subunit PstC [Anaerolineae bacterium]|nr:phosphate ABC transporter permease subunit PstC [Anaerolineae bacterium]